MTLWVGVQLMLAGAAAVCLVAWCWRRRKRTVQRRVAVHQARQLIAAQHALTAATRGLKVRPVSTADHLGRQGRPRHT